MPIARAVLADGSRVGPGDAVTARAAGMSVSELERIPDGCWGSRLAFCAPKATDELVIGSVTVTG